jgi:predicted nucleic acid-binding protein
VAVLIDTDMLVDLERGVANPAVERAIGTEDRAISVITVSELLHGVHRAKGAQRTRRGAFVEHLLAEPASNPDHGNRRARSRRRLGKAGCGRPGDRRS